MLHCLIKFCPWKIKNVMYCLSSLSLAPTKNISNKQANKAVYASESIVCVYVSIYYNGVCYSQDQNWVLIDEINANDTTIYTSITQSHWAFKTCGYRFSDVGTVNGLCCYFPGILYVTLKSVCKEWTHMLNFYLWTSYIICHFCNSHWDISSLWSMIAYWKMQIKELMYGN